MRKKEILKLIGGSKNWSEFMDWMRGQTVGTYKDGEINFYDHDVKDYMQKATGYDRQKTQKGGIDIKTMICRKCKKKSKPIPFGYCGKCLKKKGMILTSTGWRDKNDRQTNV